MSLQSASELYNFAMKIRLSPLAGICELILILLPLTFSTSPAAHRPKDKTTLGPCKDKSIPKWEQCVWGRFYKNQTNKTDINNPPVKRKVLLYSKASRRHIQVKKMELDARGHKGSEYARLVLESDNYGRLKIRGEKTNRFLCMNRKGELVARMKKQRFAEMKRCIFREENTSDGYIQFRSVKYPALFIGFSKGGRPTNGSRSAKRPIYRQFIVYRAPPQQRRRRKHLRHAIEQRNKLMRLLRMKFRL